MNPQLKSCSPSRHPWLFSYLCPITTCWSNYGCIKKQWSYMSSAVSTGQSDRRQKLPELGEDTLTAAYEVKCQADDSAAPRSIHSPPRGKPQSITLPPGQPLFFRFFNWSTSSRSHGDRILPRGHGGCPGFVMCVCVVNTPTQWSRLWQPNEQCICCVTLMCVCVCVYMFYTCSRVKTADFVRAWMVGELPEWGC